MQDTIERRHLAQDTAVVESIWNGSRCREVRTAARMSQDKLADKMKATQGAIGHWERNIRTPGADELFALCDALGVSCEVLRQKVGTPIRWLPGRKPKSTDDDDDQD